MKFVRSPINQFGNKYSLLSQLIPLFPKEVDIFVDLFGGSGTLALNYQGKIKNVYNDINELNIRFIKMFIENTPEYLDEYFRNLMREYNLETEKDSDWNRLKSQENYFKLRSYYNEKNNDIKILYLLSIYSMNHYIRFNLRNKFDVPRGHSLYNEKNYKYISNAHEKFKNMIILNKNFYDIDLKKLPKNTFIYLDPPYLNTNISYGIWNENYENKLYDFILEINNLNLKFGMSNNLCFNGVNNSSLKSFIAKNNFKIKHLHKVYHIYNQSNILNDEVYIYNY